MTGKLRRKRPEGAAEDQAATIERLRARLANPHTPWLSPDEHQWIGTAVTAGRPGDVVDLTPLARYAALSANVDPTRRVPPPHAQARMIVYHATQGRRSVAAAELAGLTGENGPTLAAQYQALWRPSSTAHLRPRLRGSTS